MVWRLQDPCSVSLVHFLLPCTIYVSQEMLCKYLLNELIESDKTTMPSQPLVWVLKSEIHCLLTGTLFGVRNLK